MYYNLASLQKLHHNIYDAGGNIIFITFSVQTSSIGLLLGIGVIGGGLMYGVPLFLQQDWLHPIMLLSLVLLGIGIWLIRNALAGIKLRKESGGIHPADTLHILNASTRTLSKRIGDVEERLASFDELDIQVHTQMGKHTRHYVQVVWPGHHLHLARGNSKHHAIELVDDIRQRLGMPPEEVAHKTTRSIVISP